MLYSWSRAAISVGSAPAMQALSNDVKMYVESDSHSAINTIFVMETINAVVDLK